MPFPWNAVGPGSVKIDGHTTMVEVDGYMEESSPKGYEERSIPVPEFTLEQLSIHIEDKTPADHVFVSSKSGSVLRNRTFRRGWFNDAAEQIGIPGLTPHELRHTCASLAVSAGANVKALQRMLGHSSAKETLDTYSDLFDEDLEIVAAALEGMGAVLCVGTTGANRMGGLDTRPRGRYSTGRKLSPLSDSNRRPPLYKSGALAN